MSGKFPLLAVILAVHFGTLAAELESTEVQEGAKLARTYCQICHLFPEPSLLDKQTWEKHALPSMMAKLGLKRVALDKIPGGHFIRAANVLPQAPMVTSNHWAAICKYYISQAPAAPLPQPNRSPIQMDLEERFTVVAAPFRLVTPMTTLVKIIPESGVMFVGDSLRRTLYLLNRAGEQINSLMVGSPPAALQLRSEGMYLTLIGYVAPSDDPIGRCLFIPKSDQGFGHAEVLLDRLPRPTDTKIADLNGDGRDDLVVAQFGNLVGRFSWYEKLVDGKYQEHVLRKEPGSLCSYIYDFNQDGRPDIIVLMAQAQEGVFLYTNLGQGQFKETALLRFPPVWGSSYFELADFNGDGLPDLLVANGDNAEYPSPMKSFHGVRIYLNDGQLGFKEAYFFPLHGAYKAVARDFDGDGKLDIACISFFPDYLNSPEESFVLLHNEGDLHFTAHSFPQCTQGRWIVMDAADLSGQGRPDIVLGAFDRGPESIPIPESTRRQWKEMGPNILILRNKGKR